jgi:hypothetical protein
LNPKAVNYMQSLFAVKDTIGKRETREISALCGVTVTQVCSLSHMCWCTLCTRMSIHFYVLLYTSLKIDLELNYALHHFITYKWTVAIKLGSSFKVILIFLPFCSSLIAYNVFASYLKHELMISFEFPFPWVIVDKINSMVIGKGVFCKSAYASKKSCPFVTRESTRIRGIQDD